MTTKNIKKTTCLYSDKNTSCKRDALSKHHYCIFHLGFDDNSEEFTKPSFQKELDQVIDKQDGNWDGFVFPSNTSFPNEISFEVNARNCKFDSLTLENCVFKDRVDFSHSKFFRNTLLRSVTFQNEVSFTNSFFLGQFETLSVQCLSNANFIRADFNGRSTLRINFKGTANFNQAIFRDGVSFSGWRNISVSAESASFAIASGLAVTITSNTKSKWHQKLWQFLMEFINRINTHLKSSWKLLKSLASGFAKKSRSIYQFVKRKYSRSSNDTTIYRMFEGEGQLQNVVFLKPDQTVFTLVDLSKVYFLGTNLRGIRFLGVRWWQASLKRNGLYDESFIRLSNDGPHRHSYLPVLEETCRNARIAIEENKNYSTASDFYIAEMEAAREQLNIWCKHLLSVNALYRFVSYYGTSVATGIRVLILILLLHTSLSLLIQNTEVNSDYLYETSLKSFKVIFQQSIEYKDGSIKNQILIDSVFKVLGLIQIGMVAIAFRSRIKRH